MKEMMNKLLFIFAGLQLAWCYPFQESFRQLLPNVDCNGSPNALSYHIHVTYMMTNEDQVREVSAFRGRTEEEFADLLGEDPVCQGTVIEPSGRYGKR